MMNRFVATLFLIACAVSNSSLSAAKTGKQHFPIMTKHAKMIFTFGSGGLSFPPGSDRLNFQAYIVAPDGKKIKGPLLTGRNTLSAFNIIVEPPILFGTYTIVLQNISVPKNQVVLFSQNVFVTNSVNTKESKAVVGLPLNTPANPGDSVVGYFNPVHSFFAH